MKPNVLVVDDAAVDRRLAGGLLEKQLACELAYAADGQEALEAIGRRLPDLVLTDLQMPGLNGLELVVRIKEDFPAVPVILMTAVGSEDIAAEALRRGAASYVPKRRLAEDLAPTAARVLAASHADRVQHRLLHYQDSLESTFTLPNDLELIGALVQHLLVALRSLPLNDETERLRVGIALEEALRNAYYHGNLELGTVVAQDASERDQLARSRRLESPYRERRIEVHCRITREEASFAVRDGGRGFDHARSPGADSLAGEPGAGRGITLMRSIVDEVRYNDAGNEVTLVKRRAPDPVVDDEAEMTLA
jgi:CheY-like chemotaxis protein